MNLGSQPYLPAYLENLSKEILSFIILLKSNSISSREAFSQKTLKSLNELNIIFLLS
jgi:hypothetical protein